MRMAQTLSASLLFALAACGQAAAPGEADAQTTAAASGEVSAADRSAILHTANAQPDSSGQVENECGEKITPRLLPVDMGGAVGTAVLLVMEGGPNTASCYGDGPGLTLLARDGANWRFVYDSRGGYMSVLTSQTNGVHDIAFAGPGFEHPLFTWNGTEFAPAGRTVSDAQTSSGTTLP